MVNKHSGDLTWRLQQLQPKSREVKEFNFTWVGQDRGGKTVRGEMRATGEAQVNALLRRQGIKVVEIKKQRRARGGKVTEKDITLFTRQLATMLKSGVPLLQAFDIVAKGHGNPAMAKLIYDVRTEVETGSSLKQAFEKHPLYFDALYCNLIGAGEAAGILDTVLERLAQYKEKILAIKSKIKSALFYPIAIVVVAFVITAVIMIFVIPAFKQVFANFGADLPALTLMVIAISDFFVEYWWAIFGAIGGGLYGSSSTRGSARRRCRSRWTGCCCACRFSATSSRKSAIARWTRTLSTTFAAGVPLVEALDSVARRRGQLRVLRRHQAHPGRGRDRLEPELRDAGHRRLPEHGDPDGRDRRGSRLARHHALQGRRLLRAGSRRRRRGALEPDGADDHGRARAR